MSADLERVIKIVFQGTDQTGQAFKDVGSGLSGVASSVGSLTQPFADAAKSILKVQTGVAVALTAIGGFAIAAAGEFEDGMAEINTLLDQTPEEFDKFKKEIRDYFKTSLFDLDDVLGATYQSISLGIPDDVVTDFLASAENLAIAGDTTLTQAVNILANTANAYGGTMDDVSGYADTFFTAVQAGGTTVTELESSMGKVIAIAAPFGVELEDVTAAIAALTAMGVGDTAESASALAMLIQNLVKPSEQAKKAAEELGIELGADIFQNKTFAEVIADIGEKTGGSAGKISEMVGSANALKAILPLVADESGVYKNAIDAQAESDDAAAEAAKKMAETFENTNLQMTNSIKDVLIGIGQPLLEDYKGAIGGITEAVNALALEIDKDDGPLEPLLDYFAGTLGKIGDFASDVAAVLPEALAEVDWDDLIDSFGDLETAFNEILGALFGGHDLTTSEGLAQAIQFAVNALTSLNTISAGILEQLPGAITAIVNIMEKIAEMDPERFGQIGKMLGAALLVNIGAGVLGNIGSAVTGFGVAIIGLKAASPVLVGFGAAMSGAVTAIAPFAAALGVGVAAGTGINAGIDKVVQKFSDSDSLGGLVYDWVHGDGSETLEAGGEDFNRILTALMDNVDKFDVSTLQDKLNDLDIDTSGLSDLEIIELAVALDELSYDDMMDIIQTRAQEADLTAQVEVDAPDEVEILLTVDEMAAKFALEQIGEDVDGLTGDQIMELYAELNPSAYEQALAEVEALPERRDIEIVVHEDGSLEVINTGLDRMEEPVEIEIESDEVKIAQIQGQFEAIQTAMEWDAKLNIAQVEAEARRVEAIMETMGGTIQSTGDLLGDLFGHLSGDVDFFTENLIRDQIKEENRMRKEAHDMTMKISEEELKMMRARREAMERGEGMIQIDGAGLQPHLEAFMWEVLAAIQVRVNEEGMDMLLGT